MEKLEQRMLARKDWTDEDLADFRTFLTEIHENWSAVTNHKPFPKLHMLRHALEFAERYHFLGRVSESKIESFHAQFNTSLNKHHLNMSHNVCERLRRSLADAPQRCATKLLPRKLIFVTGTVV
jgi:hypothetical protein